MVHIRQPMHFAFVYSTSVVPGARCNAAVGQTFTQEAVSHCWHIMGTEKPSRSQEKTWMRAAAGRNELSCWKPHANTQLRHPVHLSGWIISTLAIVNSFGICRGISICCRHPPIHWWLEAVGNLHAELRPRLQIHSGLNVPSNLSHAEIDGKFMFPRREQADGVGHGRGNIEVRKSLRMLRLLRD